MKHLAIALFATLTITGCSSTTSPQEIHVNNDEKNNTCETQIIDGQCIEQKETSLPEGIFQKNEYGNFFGEFYVRGYVETKTIPEAFCEEPCEKTYEAVSLHVEDFGNEGFKDFILKNQGNAYVNTNNALAEIMLGCIIDNKIEFENHSDEYNVTTRVLDEELSKNILSHQNKNRQMVLKLTKLQLSGGRGAPACYSHFYDIEFIDSLNTTEFSK